MSIRRVGKADKTISAPVSAGKNKSAAVGAGENFAQQLAQVAGVRVSEAVDQIAAAKSVNGVSSQGPSHHQRREQMEQASELLDTLEALGQDLDPTLLASGGNEALARQRLKETRDQALRTLSDSPAHSEERELLHRTALLATVELAKSERGDYK
ncbi:MAG: hypothetical protein HQL72_01955 [Magnetococcales bacterium]|nr:hypothetical protein [Magnetococcales bacterium]